ncbi:WD40/YVTN/BNR-like repeat-containing protein [Synoicihabitans lomoniglobus]|uniref:YCF48-related protein n=1 Tax=Synoicihabitans lomoniglobus TaxID=2909285 RepID=A0AAF0CQX7_9BACT|nr:YCF48-related protein [Opitutaceae bacterium LMO-M01]WED66427.1 YCF48-related protein [Opitutaceae bacterium LMO-M01]
MSWFRSIALMDVGRKARPTQPIRRGSGFTPDTSTAPRGSGFMPDTLRRFLAVVATLFTASLVNAAAPGPLLLDAALVGNDIVAVGERGVIRRSTDDGQTWSPVTSGVPYTLCAISFADTRNGWAAGHGAVILRTTDGGKIWAHQFTGPDPESPFLDVLALDHGHVIAVGAFGAFFESHDAGATWEQQWILDDDVHLNRITRTVGGTLFLAGEFGTLLRSTDHGATWEHLSTGDDGSLYGVIELANDSLLAYGLRGRVYRSTDHGDNWTALKTPGTGLIMTGIELASARTVILAGQARTWWMSHDHGATFVAAGDVTPAIAEVLLTPHGKLLTFGEDGAQVAP